uniref:Uncharacterized protein n=1 Tax=Anguilla anguilla TaxID=7936 RepID=A0A0E9VV85_ANGAN
MKMDRPPPPRVRRLEELTEEVNV